MKKNVLSFTTLFASILFTFLTSCTSEDILPAVSLSISDNSLSEDNGTVILTASLNGAASENIVIPIVFSGSATINSDFNASSSEIRINNGQTTGSVSFSGVIDGLIEGDETVEITVGNSNNVLILSAANFTITVRDADIDTDIDGVPDASDQCPNVAGNIANNGCPFVGFIINEVLYDPADGIAGDANGDGTRDPNGDEFIEFFNSSATSLNISGYTISDASQVRHTFPTGTIVPSKGVIVVFGGGTPTGTFGGAIAQTASGGQLNMTNAGDLVTIKDTNGTTILTFDINGLSGNPNEAFTRFPDIYGNFVRYSTIPDSNGVIQTPGRKVNGTSF